MLLCLYQAHCLPKIKQFYCYLNLNHDNDLIKTKKDYQQALTRLEEISDAKKGSSEGDVLEVLGILIEKYEGKHFSMTRRKSEI